MVSGDLAGRAGGASTLDPTQFVVGKCLSLVLGEILISSGTVRHLVNRNHESGQYYKNHFPTSAILFCFTKQRKLNSSRLIDSDGICAVLKIQFNLSPVMY